MSEAQELPEGVLMGSVSFRWARTGEQSGAQMGWMSPHGGPEDGAWGIGFCDSGSDVWNFMALDDEDVLELFVAIAQSVRMDPGDGVAVPGGRLVMVLDDELERAG